MHITLTFLKDLDSEQRVLNGSSGLQRVLRSSGWYYLWNMWIEILVWVLNGSFSNSCGSFLSLRFFIIWKLSNDVNNCCSNWYRTSPYIHFSWFLNKFLSSFLCSLNSLFIPRLEQNQLIKSAAWIVTITILKTQLVW